MRIKDFMTQPVVSCSADSSLDVPARLMWECDCGVVVLTDRDGRLAGVVTDRDVAMAALLQNKPLRELPVSSAMAHNVAFCHVGDMLEAVEQVMRESRVRRVPIVDDDRKPVGIVSLNDLARFADRSHKQAIDRALITTLSAVSQPRFDSSPASRLPKP